MDQDKLEEILSDLFADGRSIGHTRPVTAAEWEKYIGEALTAIHKEFAAENARLVSDLARAVGLLEGLGHPDEYLSARLSQIVKEYGGGK